MRIILSGRGVGKQADTLRRVARGELLWTPSAEMVEGAAMTRFMRHLDRGFESYDDLWRWSVEDLEGFWASIWDYFGVEAEYDRVLGSRSMPGAEWFPGARINYAEHLLRPDRDAGAV